MSVSLNLVLVVLIAVCAVIVNGIVLDYRPKPPAGSKTTHSDLIWYKVNNYTDFLTWTDEINSFLDGYRRVSVINETVPCNYNNKASQGQICDLEPTEKWYPCVAENNYGYHKGSPCVLLVLNEAFGWVPEAYDDVTNLPKEMPKDLQKHILSESINDPNSIKTVWVSCGGDTPADIENAGPIQYLPFRGYPGYYFPLKISNEPLNPVIAIWFKRPALGIAISVTCRAWAKNLHNGGSVNFELLID